MRSGFVSLILAVLLAGGGLAAGGPDGFSGSFGMEFSFIPTPPASLDVNTTVSLELGFGKGSVTSRTELSLSGLEAEYIELGIDYDDASLATGMRFDPCFSRYWFQVEGGCCPFDFGGFFLVENLADVCQTPDFTVGAILELGLEFPKVGFHMHSYTGFGLQGLYYFIDDDPTTDVIAVAGWAFEEELLDLGFSGDCFQIGSVLLFDQLGFSWVKFSTSYRWYDPQSELGPSLKLGLDAWLGPTLSSGMFDFTLAVGVKEVELESVTSFDWNGFLSQELSVSVTISGLELHSRTVFDFSGLTSETVGFSISF